MTTAATQKAYRGLGMEGPIARWYEKTTRKDIRSFRKLADRLSVGFPNGGDMLEIAPGPGFLAIEMARRGSFRVTGLDISKTFVELAQKNAAVGRIPVDFRQGNASQMPFADNSFDLLVCRAAFKNFSQPLQALQEMHRVLRPGATGIIIDLRRDVPMVEIKKHVDHMGLSILSRWFTLFTFRFMLLKRAYTTQEFEQMLKGISFAETEVLPDEIGMEIRFEK